VASAPQAVATHPAQSGAAALASVKIHARHRDRLVIVYVRQSSPKQVFEHRESRERQYALVDRAIALGWPAERILVIDEDQGQSGQTSVDRTGFQRLLLEVNLDHVGLILGLEMNRLARSSKDWQQLFEVCAVFATLLGDEDGVYEPNDPNDRLLLGLKGIISEVELHTMHTRLRLGSLHKAQRGELFTLLPIGYVRSSTGQVELDPDEQVQAVVRLVFAKFEELGSSSAVFRYLAQHQIRMGVRPINGPNRGRLEWRRPNRTTVNLMVRNPIYAGAYVYGRRSTDPKRKALRQYSTNPSRSIDNWSVLLRDRLPAYISWEQYLANCRRLEENRARWASKGAPREGACLLGGLIHCAHCGDRMKVIYRHGRGDGAYVCQRGQWDPSTPRRPGHGVPSHVLDPLVSEQVLHALEPATLELSLQATAELERQRQQLEQLWKQRLERARYEAERAERQYQAVEPENRLVARTLEQRWEQALVQERQLREEYDRFARQSPSRLTPAERERIRTLARDLPALWTAPATTAKDRQEVVRHLVERVEVAVQEESEITDVVIHWVGGHVSAHQLRRPVNRYEQLQDFERLRQRIVELRDAGRSAAEIAAGLNQEGFRPPRGTAAYTGYTVSRFLVKYGLSAIMGGQINQALVRAHEWRVPQLAQELKVSPWSVRRWCRRGWVQARPLPGAPNRWIVWADRQELKRLRRLRDYAARWIVGDPYPEELITPTKRRKRDV
jgi:DNA invertase Pin-like site-specific DNA recombinase